MIFYGTNSSKVQAEELERVSCASCGQKPVYVVTHARYAHVYWIPFFSIGRVSATECSHCHQVLEKKDMPDSYREQLERQKGNAKIPVWHFAGVFLIAIAIVVGIVASKNDDKRMIGLIGAAQPGDKYHVKYSSSEYTLWKVLDATADSVYYSPHEYVVNQPSGLKESPFTGDDDYSEDLYVISTATLLQMVEDGEIRDVVRK